MKSNRRLADIGKEFDNSNEFSMYIEDLSKKENITCLEALVDYANQSDLDVEDLAEYVNDSLKSKLYQNYVDLGMIKKNKALSNFFI